MNAYGTEVLYDGKTLANRECWRVEREPSEARVKKFAELRGLADGQSALQATTNRCYKMRSSERLPQTELGFLTMGQTIIFTAFLSLGQI